MKQSQKLRNQLSRQAGTIVKALKRIVKLPKV